MEGNCLDSTEQLDVMTKTRGISLSFRMDFGKKFDQPTDHWEGAGHLE